MADSKSTPSYLQGAAILAAAVAIVKVIGALYKIPLGNILGGEGYSTFTVSYNIYAFLLTVSTAGLPVALSKMISSANALGRPRQVRQVFTIGRNAFFCLGVISFFVMAIFAEQLASASNSVDAALSIRALSPAMLFVCLISAYRGYFQGFSNMVPTSVSQIIEALAKLILGLGLAWYLSSIGSESNVTVAGAVLGVTAGTVVACIYLALTKRRADRRVNTKGSLDTPDTNRRILRNLLDIAIPLTLGASILSIINLIDTPVVLSRLQSAGGYTYTEAKFLHGTYAYTMTLFNLPSSFILTITMALIPAITALIAKGDSHGARITSESGIKVSCLLAMPAGVGLMVLADPIMNVLYYGNFSDEGPGLMAIMGVASFFICFFQVTNCVLQAYGFQKYTVLTLPIGGIIKIALNWILMANPNIGIYGAAISTLACYGTISVINVVLVKLRIPNSPSFTKILVRPAICTALMGLATWASYGLLHSLLFSRFPSAAGTGERMLLAVAMAAAIVIAIVVYLVLIIALRAITAEDMKMVPRGEKLAKLLRIR